MDALISFLIKWLKKNKTLFVVIFSITFLLCKYDKEIDSVFLHLLKIFLISFSLTRFLVYIDIINILLRIPYLADFIFFFGYKEHIIMQKYNAGKEVLKKYLNDLYQYDLIVIDKDKSNFINIMHETIGYLVIMQERNLISNMKIFYGARKYNLNKALKLTQDSTQIHHHVYIWADLNPRVRREMDKEKDFFKRNWWGRIRKILIIILIIFPIWIIARS